MRQTRYTSVYTIIRQIYRDLGIEDVNEADAIEWAADAVEQMSIKENYTINTAFLEVDNYYCDMPDNLVKVLQIAKSRKCDRLPKTPKSIIIEVDNDSCGCNTMESSCGCSGQKTRNPHLMFCSSFVRNFGLVFGLGSVSGLKQRWIEVEPTGNNFFNSGVCNGGELTSDLQYRLNNGKILFSFEKGLIALSYVTPMLDEEGMPMIPDDVSAREAVSKYIIMKLMAREWYKGREGTQDKMIKAEQDWHWYCKQYKSKMAMPDEDDYRKLMRQELRTFPVFIPDHFGHVNACMCIDDCDIFDNPYYIYDPDSGYIHIDDGKGNKTSQIIFGYRDSFPIEGNENYLYVDMMTNEIYRWDNTDYVILSDVTIDKLDRLINVVTDDI